MTPTDPSTPWLPALLPTLDGILRRNLLNPNAKYVAAAVVFFIRLANGSLFIPPILQPSATVDFDPLVVDDTAELDRILAPKPSTRPPLSRSPQSACSSPAPQSPRPKLSDALKNATFSPKRPRSVPPHKTTPRTQRIYDSPGHGRYHSGGGTPG